MTFELGAVCVISGIGIAIIIRSINIFFHESIGGKYEVKEDWETKTLEGICKIKIDGLYYNALLYEHHVYNHYLDSRQAIVLEHRVIRKYELFEEFPAFKEEPFKVICDNGHESMCYMSDDRKIVFELEWRYE